MLEFARTAALLLLVPATGFGQSVHVLEFDDLVGAGPVSAGYGGVANWGTWSYSDVPDPALPAWSGAVRIAATGPQRTIGFGQDVVFGSVRVVAEAPFQVRLLRAGQVVWTSSQYSANAGGPPRFISSFFLSEAIDTFELVCSSDRHAVDNLVYAVAPPTLGTVFCFPNQINSVGRWGVLAASGSLLAADNDLTLHATDLPQGSWGYAIVSATQGFVPSPTGPGVLCINGQIGRFIGPGQVVSSGTTGAFDVPVDLSNVPTPTGFIPTSAGDVWSFQVWYRDSTSWGSSTSHFTSGVEITFQ